MISWRHCGSEMYCLVRCVLVAGTYARAGRKCEFV